MLHIVLANQWYPPHTGSGGVAAHNLYLAHALVKLGHRVTVVAARWSSDIPATAHDNGVTVHRVLSQDHYRLRRLPVLGRYVRPVQQWLYSRRVAVELRRLEQVDRPDVIEFVDVNAEAFVYLHARKRVKTVIRCQTPVFVLRNYYQPAEMPYDTALTSAMEKYCLHKADLLTAPSHDMAQTIAFGASVPVDSISVIPNALDGSLFTSGEPHAYKTEGIIILHVGRLDRAKGIEVLAAAIPQVVRQCPAAQVVFVGDDRPTGEGDTWQQRLSREFVQAGVEKNVTFTGPVDQKRLAHWYSRADIAVVPSVLYESFSYTCAQAMAAGVPIVASRIGGIPETLADGVTGILVEPGNVASLAEMLVSLCRDADLRQRMGRAGQERVRSLFRPSVVAQQMAELYHELSTDVGKA